MRIGDLRHRAILQKKEIAQDVLMQQSEIWINIATVWSAIEPVSGREYFAAKQINDELSAKITIRYRNYVTPDMRVVYDTRVFEILSIIDPGERHEALVLICREVMV